MTASSARLEAKPKYKKCQWEKYHSASNKDLSVTQTNQSHLMDHSYTSCYDFGLILTLMKTWTLSAKLRKRVRNNKQNHPSYGLQSCCSPQFAWRTWTLYAKQHEKRLNILCWRCLRSIFNMKWWDKLPNVEIFATKPACYLISTPKLAP